MGEKPGCQHDFPSWKTTYDLCKALVLAQRTRLLSLHFRLWQTLATSLGWPPNGQLHLELLRYDSSLSLRPSNPPFATSNKDDNDDNDDDKNNNYDDDDDDDDDDDHNNDNDKNDNNDNDDNDDDNDNDT